MKVKFFAYLRDYTKTMEIEIDSCLTLQELLVELCDRYGSNFKRKVFNGKGISNEIIILVNGRNIMHLQGIDTKLNKEDEISIFPVVAGG
jgi:molybdopterin synthase sulfur carrier subunit